MSPLTEPNPTGWYMLRGREQSGPHTVSFIRAAARAGGLARHDLVWRMGWDDWRSADTVDGLFDGPQTAAQTEPPRRPGAPPIPGNASPIASVPFVQPVLGPPPAVAGPAVASSNYLVRHWRGELSLAQAFWLDGFLSGVAMRVIEHATNWFVDADQSRESYQVVIVLAAYVLALLTITGWLLVGIWRSASRHRARGGWALWAWSAKFFVIVEVLALIFVTAYFDLPQIAENAQIALEDHDAGGHTFQLLRDGTELEFSGGITLGTARHLASILAGAPNVKVLHLHSGGGRTVDGSDMAEQVAKRGLETYVSAECSSACTHVFLAGRKRWLGEHAKLGFHQVSATGASARELREANRYEREYLKALGLPADFVEKALSTPSSSIWYPTHDELLSAHAISGIAKKGTFAESSEAAELTAILLGVPVYAAMQKAKPALFDAFVDAVSLEYQKGDGAGKALASADGFFSDVVDRLLPHASDALVLERTSIYVGYMERLQSIDPESCAALEGGNGPAFKADLKQFPELSNREIAFRVALVVTTDLDRPVPTASQVEPYLTNAFKKMDAQFGDDANLLGKDTLAPTEYKRHCEVVTSFYREIMRLPGPQAANVLRYLYSE